MSSPDFPIPDVPHVPSPPPQGQGGGTDSASEALEADPAPTAPSADAAAHAAGVEAPAPPGSDPSAPDGTLGGYIRVHTRPPAFEGADGQPYSVSIEVEKVASLTAPWQGYLVFPRWAETGVGIVGHVETETLSSGVDADAARAALEELPLSRVKDLLDGAIRARAPHDPATTGGPDHDS